MTTDGRAAYDQTALRAAVLIHEQLSRRGTQDTAWYLSEVSWTTAARLRRQIALAREHGWHRAAARLLGDLTAVL